MKRHEHGRHLHDCCFLLELVLQICTANSPVQVQHTTALPTATWQLSRSKIPVGSTDILQNYQRPQRRQSLPSKKEFSDNVIGYVE